MKMWNVISGVVSTLFVASILTFGLSTEIASAHGDHSDDCLGPHKKDEGCGGGGGDGDSSGGGKALLFVSDDAGCAGAIDTTPPSFGHVDWNENILFSTNLHVHFKLQLKDVDPGTYDILGNQEQACQACADDDECMVDDPMPGDDVDFPACEGGICTLGHVAVTVKQNRRGRTDGVLRFPVVSANLETTAWVRVDVIIDGLPKTLHSPAVMMVLPPNVP